MFSSLAPRGSARSTSCASPALNGSPLHTRSLRALHKALCCSAGSSSCSTEGSTTRAEAFPKNRSFTQLDGWWMHVSGSSRTLVPNSSGANSCHRWSTKEMEVLKQTVSSCGRVDDVDALDGLAALNV